MRLAFCHPDLGLGGAERLVVDAALELKTYGHSVDIFTAHHDPRRCFVETRDGSLPPIRVHGNWFPRHIFGFAHALCAVFRCWIVALAICFSGTKYDAIFVDQVSAVLPLFKLLRPSIKILFYCHFPDLLLSKRGNWLRRLYRWPLDTLEESTTGQADLVLVNSAYTADIFAKTFLKLHRKGVFPRVLYPATRMMSISEQIDIIASWRMELPDELVQFFLKEGTATFLSINRYERKKKIELAIQALHKLTIQSTGKRPQLVIAGGYDSRVRENREVFNELVILVQALDLEHQVYFIRSFTDRQKFHLLCASVAVIYTPPEEHFGIVPLESMAFERPVIACDSGGPTESIVDGKTGFLVKPTPEAFANCMKQLASDEDLCAKMGTNGRAHVNERFSRRVFGLKLVEMLTKLCEKKDA